MKNPNTKVFLNTITKSEIDSSKFVVTGAGVDTSCPSNNDTGLELARRVSITITNN